MTGALIIDTDGMKVSFDENTCRVNIFVITHVHRGQLIAYSGSTGNSTGPHCHFEVRTPTASYNDCVDPEIYLP